MKNLFFGVVFLPLERRSSGELLGQAGEGPPAADPGNVR
jgi:hypothetical protein